MKKPSEPSLIVSAISCIDLGPKSFYRMSQRIYILIPMKTYDIMKAVKVITVDVDYDTKR